MSFCSLLVDLKKGNLQNISNINQDPVGNSMGQGIQQVRPTIATAAACKFIASLSVAAATPQLMKQKFQQRSIQQSLMQSQSAIFCAIRISTSAPTIVTISYESAATVTAPTGFHFASATNINASAANYLNTRRMLSFDRAQSVITRFSTTVAFISSALIETFVFGGMHNVLVENRKLFEKEDIMQIAD
ncbi:hypothetical protein M9H77_09397 [Catharanthus roseus]|uniref:Uncharacterized protein n=1 Tax=Catharanthus roseus TaxID=4058 RepID=A0ACC0C0T4_CATRO|nr:hypothetical protein M9H77_09397 [Catharanthus roseus]